MRQWMRIQSDDSPTSPSAEPVIPMEMPSSTSAELQNDNEVTEMIVQESTADDHDEIQDNNQGGQDNSDMETGSAINDALNNLFVPIHDAVPPQEPTPPPLSEHLEEENAPNPPEPDNTVEVMNSSQQAVDSESPLIAPASTPAAPSAGPDAAAASAEPTGRSRFISVLLYPRVEWDRCFTSVHHISI